VLRRKRFTRYIEMNERGLNSIDETAARLGLCPGTIRMWVAAGRIEKVKLGRRVLIHEREIERLIAQNTIPRLPEHK
jgi:excisionase family DNA binding protein